MMPERGGDGRALDPEHWQRLSPWAIGFLFARVIVDFVRNNLPIIAGAGAGVALIERIGVREVVLAGAAVILLVALACLVHHRRFRFRLDDDTLLVRRGVIEQTELRLRADRIQHLGIEAPLYLRLFGLVRLTVDTPGGNATQVELPGIRAGVAEELRSRLATAARAADADAEPASAQPGGTAVLFAAGPRDLLLHGLVSNYAYVLFAAIAPFLGQVETLLRWLLADTALGDQLARLAERPLVSAGVLTAGLLAALVSASVAIAWLRFHGFVLYRRDERFQQTSGLVNRQEQSLSRARLQSVEHVRTALGRVLGRSHLVCRQVGAVLPGAEAAGRSFLVPGLQRSAAARLIAVFWPGIEPDVALARVSSLYVRVLALRWSLALAAAVAAGAALAGNAWFLLLVPALPLATWPLAWLRWRAVAWAVDDGYVRVRIGLLGLRTTLFPLANVQRIVIHEGWFQRRHGLASLTFTLASGPVTIPFLPRARADALANGSLAVVEAGAAGLPSARG